MLELASSSCCCRTMREGSATQPSKTSSSASGLQQKDQQEKQKAWDTWEFELRKLYRAWQRESEAGTCTAAPGEFVQRQRTKRRVTAPPSSLVSGETTPPHLCLVTGVISAELCSLRDAGRAGAHLPALQAKGSKLAGAGSRDCPNPCVQHTCLKLAPRDARDEGDRDGTHTLCDSSHHVCRCGASRAEETATFPQLGLG